MALIDKKIDQVGGGVVGVRPGRGLWIMDWVFSSQWVLHLLLLPAGCEKAPLTHPSPSAFSLSSLPLPPPPSAPPDDARAGVQPHRRQRQAGGLLFGGLADAHVPGQDTAQGEGWRRPGRCV